MEERARLKALEALFDPTTTARIVALPAAGGVVIAVEASPVSQYDLMMISPPSWLSAKRVSRSWYAASAKFARTCNRHFNRKE